ncbi:MAG TPA: M23 family metallopeptidase [Burkholderiales bacterium]|nr:M23 family metallopeptidase [Burkholderiales bacterium]
MLKRFVSIFLWLLFLGVLLWIFQEPLGRARTMWSLWRETLHPPLAIPVKDISALRIVNSWEAARSGGRKHQGVDIFAPCGREVLSATRGVVVRLGDNNLGGQIVGVFGPGGSWHYYAHLSRFSDIKRGDVVQPGSVLGYVGNTGNARGGPCHLHYGIYLRGKATNPYPYLRP